MILKNLMMMLEIKMTAAITPGLPNVLASRQTGLLC